VSEFWLEVGLFDKARLWNVALGLAMMGCGQALRSLAMVTAGSNFTHQIAERRRAGHVLVTSGVYALCRHPSYAGWLLWCVGTQVFLGNPICSVGYFVVTWRFFRERIRVEEEYLVDFFGNAYSEYRRAVPFSGVPFVS
jgi:protein-S-isoprenylcysteine O-methyltransferase